MKNTISIFAPLTSEQIRSTQPDQFDDYDLLDVYNHFSENDDERAIAILEVILRSHDYSDSIRYDDLYEAITEDAYHAKDWQRLLRWAYARLAHDEQHEQGVNRILILSKVAGAYCDAGDPDTGLAIYTRCLETDAEDLDAYELAASRLADLGLRDLALAMAARAVQVAGIVADDATVAYFQEVHDELASGEDEIATPLPVSADVLDAFQRFLATEHTQSEATRYAPPIDRLLESSDDDELLRAEILAEGKILAGDLIRLAFDPDFDQTPASRAAVDFLRHLYHSRTVALDELEHFLEHAVGNWRPLASTAFGKIGPYPTDEVEAVAGDIAINAFIRSHALSALRERAEKIPSERERVVAIFRHLLTRPEAYDLAGEETTSAHVISEAVDLEATELYAEIEQAFREDRVDLQILDLGFVQEEWGMPLSPQPERRQDGLYLPLECQKCGRTREHFVQHIFLDLGTTERRRKGESTKYDPYVMDREIVCPKCGARDRYHVGTIATLRLLSPTSSEDLYQVFTGHPERAKIEIDPRLEAAKATAFSQVMHPLEALERYRMLILTHPKRAENHVRAGKVLRSIHRSAPALEAIRKGHELEPDNLDWIMERALAEHDLGDKALARTLYDQVIQRVSKTIVKDELMLETAAWARQGLADLRRGRPSPWHEMTFGTPAK